MRISTRFLICAQLLFCLNLSATEVFLPLFGNSSASFLFKPFEKNILPDPSKPDSLAFSFEEIVDPVAVVNPDLCGQGIGSIDLSPDPLTSGPWTYFWSTGATTQDLTSVVGGTYSVTVFSLDDGRAQVLEVVVPDNSIPSPMITAVMTGNTLCGGVGNGAIDLTVFPIPSAFTYQWSNGATTMDISGLDFGSYTVTVTFGTTCSFPATFVVPNNSNAPVPQQAGVTPDICEQGNGTAGVLAVGGVTPYTYEWSNGSTALQATNLAAGAYTVTITGANGCSNTASVDVNAITVPVNISQDVVTENTTCIGGNGSISINVSPGGPTYSFLWSNGATTQNLTNLPSGTYWVTVTRFGTCTSTEFFDVFPDPVIPELSFGNITASCGNSNGSVNLTPLAGGAPPYTYLWSGGETTQDLNNLAAGSYTVTVTGANGCTATGEAIIDDTPIIFGYTAVVTDQTACDTVDGKIVLALSPPNLAYQWSNGVSSTVLTSLAPGDYTVTISAGGTCTAVETYNVGDVREYPVIPILPDTTTCGRANANLDLSVLGGATSPFTYEWSNGATTQDLTNIKADTFYVTVTSAVGCATQNAIIIPNVDPPINLTGNVVDNFSCLAPTGVIDLIASPLDTAYTYLWSGGQTTDSLFNLSSGDYLVTVTLGLTCVALDTFTVINNALPPNLSSTTLAANCSLNNGSADLNLSGGIGPFAYIWSTTETTEDLQNLAPGTYTVTVTGANDCSAVNSVTVLNNGVNLNLSAATVQNTSCVAANGSVDLGVNPPGAYTYAWSNAETTEDLSSLLPGSYTVTVSLGSCLSTSTFDVLDNALDPNLSASGTSANCDLADGAADLSVTGGVGPFGFAWSNLANTEDLNGLVPGTYTVTVTGANGCTSTSAVNVQNNSIVLNINANPVGNTSCTTPDGALDISVNPAGTYAYAWSNLANTEDLSSLPAGSYTVTVSLGTCQSTSTFQVADNTASPSISPSITASICGVNNGAIDLSVSGPGAPYTYQWSNLETTEDLSSLFPGNYAVTVSATNGCTSTAILNVANNASTFSLAATAAPQTDCATNNGSIDLNVTPVGAFTFQWSNSETTEDLSNLPPGTYTVSVTESGSCTATASYFVVDQRVNPATAQTVVAELCGLSDGSIDLGVSGGSAPFSYQWASGQNTQDLANIAAGNYAVTVTDANNCTATASAIVPGNSISFALAGSASTNSSCIQNNGAIDLVVNPAPPGYTFTWSGGQNSEDLSGLNAGTYTVTVSAGGNCTNTAVFSVVNDVPSPVLAEGITASFCGQTSGAIDLTVSGSPTPYQYIWSNTATTQDLAGVLAGTYSVTVTAANGCTTVDNFVVTEDVVVPTITSSITEATSCTSSNGGVDLSITPALPYTYVWSNSTLTEDLTNIAAGIYTVTVSAGGTCTNTAIVTVTSNVPAPALANSIVAATCGQASGSIDLSVSVGPTPYTYLWSNAVTNEDLSTLLSGIYNVTVTAANGCTTTAAYTVQENTITPGIASALTPANSCLTDNGAINLSITPAGTYTFTWSNGNQTEDLANLAAGTYTVTVNGGGACTNTASLVVADQTTQPQAAITSNTTALDCSTTNIILNGTASGTPNATSIAWSSNGNPLGTGNTLSVTNPGTYQLLVVDDVTSCTSTASIVITQSLNPPALTAAAPALLTCTNPSQTLSGSSTVAGVQLAWASINGPDTTILAQGATLSVSTTGTYYLLGFNPANGCENAISVNVTANQTPPTADAGTAFILDCAGETAGLNGSGTGAANLSYQWTTQDGHFVSGANLANPLIDEAGTYVLAVTNPINGCTDTDEVVIVPEIPVAYASVQQPTCKDEQGAILVDSVTGLSEPILYSLNNSQPGTQDQFNNLDPGVYTLQVQGGNGCSATAELTVNEPTLVEITLTPEAEIALGYGYLFDATLNIPDAEIASVTWTPSTGLLCDTCLNTFATPFSTTNYKVLVVSTAGCEARGSVLVKVDKTRKVYGPNIFSPDDDGSNDVFTIFADPITVLKIKSLRVYSRWGEEVFERLDFAPGDTNIGWDGTHKGQKLNPSVFVWQAVVEFVDGQEELFFGDVTLQR